MRKLLAELLTMGVVGALSTGVASGQVGDRRAALLAATGGVGGTGGAGSVRVISERLGAGDSGPEILRLTRAAEGDARPRTAVLVVGGLDPRQRRGPEITLAIAERLVKDHAGVLEKFDVYVLAALNPDVRVGGDGQGARGVRLDSARLDRALVAIDDDRDGRMDEDGPVDIDGDGRVLWMRIKNPPPGLGLAPEMVTEPDDPRLMRPANRSKGEQPSYAVIVESTDKDGDGQYGEDGTLGVDVDRVFPYHWPEFRDEAGHVPLEEPGTRALVEWLQARPSVVGMIVYTSWDTIVNTPGGGKMDQTGEAPADNHVLDDDRGVLVELSEKYKGLTKQEKPPTRDNAGSLQGWAYAQLGLWSMAADAWVREDQLKKPEKKKGEGEEKPEGQPTRKVVDSDEGRWLAISDAAVLSGGEPGFVEWKAFKHPILGDVEIGGFVPGFKQDIPAADVERVAGEQAPFVAALVERLPRLELGPVLVERLGEGVWRVSVAARNVGQLPTRSAMGVRVRRQPPVRLGIDVDRARVLSGRPTQGMDAVPAGGRLEASWTIIGAVGDKVRVTLASPECGDAEIQVELAAGAEVRP